MKLKGVRGDSRAQCQGAMAHACACSLESPPAPSLPAIARNGSAQHRPRQLKIAAAQAPSQLTAPSLLT